MMNNITDVVKNLIIINAIIFIGVSMTVQFSGLNIEQYFELYSPLSNNFKPVQLVTHMFMHGSISHLFFNMLSLFFLGPYVEHRMGSKRFLIFYLVCGFGAMLSHLGVGYLAVADLTRLISPEQLNTLLTAGSYTGTGLSNMQAQEIFTSLNTPVVGASGAIYGVIIAFALFYPNLQLMLLFPPIPIKAKYLALIIIAIDLFSGVSGHKTGVAHFAHLGGGLTGLILILIWYKNIFKR